MSAEREAAASAFLLLPADAPEGDAAFEAWLSLVGLAFSALTCEHEAWVELTRSLVTGFELTAPPAATSGDEQDPGEPDDPGPAPHRRYSSEERREAIALAEELGTSRAATRLGIPYATLWQWAGSIKAPPEARPRVDHDAARARAAGAAYEQAVPE